MPGSSVKAPGTESRSDFEASTERPTLKSCCLLIRRGPRSPCLLAGGGAGERRWLSSRVLYLLDTNVISELRHPRPHGAVVAWLEGIADDDLHHPERIGRVVMTNGGPLRADTGDLDLLPADRDEARRLMAALRDRPALPVSRPTPAGLRHPWASS